MSWTKRQFVEAAFEEIGYAVYNFDLEPAQLEKAMQRCDAMMAQWDGLGIRIGYPLPNSPQNSSLDSETNVPLNANETIFTNLAIRIAPTVGKTASNETKAIARAGYLQLLNHHVVPAEKQMPEDFPRGQGRKPWRYDQNFTTAPETRVPTGGDGSLDFVEEQN